MSPLEPQFLARASAAVRADAAGRPSGWLEQRLAELLRAAHAAYPELAFAPAAAMGWLAERVADGAALDEELAALHVPDLLLACACAHGDAAAHAAFEARHLDEVGRVVASLGMPAAALDEAKQITRIHLLGGGGGRPAIAAYSGRGSLRGWLRVTLARELYRVVRKDKRDTPLDERDLDQTPVLGDDPEVAYLKRRYRQEFADAFAGAVAGLDAADRHLLRLHFVSRHSIDEIGVLLRIHRATAARRLVAARAALVAATRAGFLARCRVDDAQLESILRLIESQLDLSVRAVLVDESDETA